MDCKKLDFSSYFKNKYINQFKYSLSHTETSNNCAFFHNQKCLVRIHVCSLVFRLNKWEQKNDCSADDNYNSRHVKCWDI